MFSLHVVVTMFRLRFVWGGGQSAKSLKFQGVKVELKVQKPKNKTNGIKKTLTRTNEYDNKLH